MVKNKNLAKPFAIIGLVLMAFVIFFSFGAISYETRLDCQSVESDLKLDTVSTTFTGSPVVLPYTDKILLNNNTNSVYGSSIMFSLKVNSDLILSIDKFYISYLDNGSTTWIEPSLLSIYYNNTNYEPKYDLVNHQLILNNTRVSFGAGQLFAFRFLVSGNNWLYLNNVFLNYSDTLAGNNFTSCTIGSESREYGLASNFLRYDTDSYWFSLNFLTFRSDALHFLPRTYYFATSNADYNQGYDAGFRDGKREGVQEGDRLGYDRGFEWGKEQGRSIGYNEGVQDANDYSFLGLFGAMIDAPIQAFTGLLDFDVFGIDAKSLVLSLFTLSIVLVIIRLATKGGGN